MRNEKRVVKQEKRETDDEHATPSGGSRLKVGMVVITLFLRPKIR